MPEISSRTAAIRIAIEEILTVATQPMTTQQMASEPQIQELGISAEALSREMYAVMKYKRKQKPFPVKRMRNPYPSKGIWAYYNPKVIDPFTLDGKPRGSKPNELTRVNSAQPPAPLETQQFQFDPVVAAAQLDGLNAPVAAPVPLHVEAARTVTITVAGVTIKIDVQPVPGGGV